MWEWKGLSLKDAVFVGIFTVHAFSFVKPNKSNIAILVAIPVSMSMGSSCSLWFEEGKMLEGPGVQILKEFCVDTELEGRLWLQTHVDESCTWTTGETLEHPTLKMVVRYLC